MQNDIAVIGFAFRLPEAETPEVFFKNLLDGKDSVRSISRERIADTGLDMNQEFMQCGYLEDVDKFDFSFFHISPREAEDMHPVQRLLLETSYHAFENAGYNIDALSNTATGIYLNDYESDYMDKSEQVSPTLVTGNLVEFGATRLARYYNLTGPVIVINTSCSSSSVALYLACNDLILGNTQSALVCGTNVYLEPYAAYFSHGDIFSPDWKSKAFSGEANGMSNGEAVVALVLKRLDKAEEDGDYIHGVIKSIAVNSNGDKASSLTAPDSSSQCRVIKQAWKKAGINPADISYIEAHGSGTQLGDCLEVEGLDMAFKKYTPENSICPISTLKSNIGHSRFASGITGVVKALLCLKYRKIPSTINFKTPNSLIDFKNSAVFVNTRIRELDKNEIYIGVSSVGASGVNSHVLVSSYDISNKDDQGDDGRQSGYLFPFSAKSASALLNNINSLYDAATHDSCLKLADISYTLSTCRKHYNYRAVFLAKDLETLQNQIKEYKINDQPNKKPYLIFVFENNSKNLFKKAKALLESDKEFNRFVNDRNINIHDDHEMSFSIQYNFFSSLLKCNVIPDDYLIVGKNKFVKQFIDGDLSFTSAIDSYKKSSSTGILNLEKKISLYLDREDKGDNILFIQMGFENDFSTLFKSLLNKEKMTLLNFDSTANAVLNIIQALYMSDFDINFNFLFESGKNSKVVLPGYKFDKTHCWLKTKKVKPGKKVEQNTRSLSAMDLFILNCWIDALELEEIEAHDNFFDIGGDSLKATIVINEINKKLCGGFDFEDLFDYQDFTSFSQYINDTVSLKNKILFIWKTVLKQDEITHETNFFSIGGHSLIASEIIAMIAKDSNVILDFDIFYNNPTVNMLVDYIESNYAKSDYKKTEPPEENDSDESADNFFFGNLLSDDEIKFIHTKHDNIEKAWVITPLQHIILNYNLMFRNSFNIFSCSLDDINQNVLLKAIQLLIDRHEILRSFFLWKKISYPVQVIADKVDEPLVYYDFSDLPDKEKENSIQEMITRNKKEIKLNKPGLYKFILIKSANNKFLFIWLYKYSLLDGWSLGTVLEELFSSYNSLNANKKPVANKKAGYLEFVKWIYEKANNQKIKNYWVEEFDGYSNENVERENKKRVMNNEKILFDHAAVKILKGISVDYSMSILTVVIGALALFLDSDKNNDVTFGLSVSGRKIGIDNIKNTVGLFTNIIPVRIKKSNSLNAREYFNALHLKVLDIDNYCGSTPYEISKYTGLPIDQLNPIIYDKSIITLNFLNNDIEKDEVPIESSVDISINRRFFVSYDMQEEKLLVEIIFNSNKYEMSSFKNKFEQFIQELFK